MGRGRVLVTGAAGFVGACLTRRLVERGDEVTALVRPRSDLWRLREVAPRLRLVEGDLCEPGSVERAVLEARADVVYHLAAHGGNSAQTDARQILQANVLGTLHLLQACVGSPCRLFVAAGSSSEYGFKTAPMRETDRLDPSSYYAVGKAAATHLCQLFGALRRFPIATLRLFSVYGPFEARTRLVPTLLRRALAGEPLELVSPAVARDFVYIDDVVDAFLRQDELSRLEGEVLNIGGGVQRTVRDAVDLVLELTGSSSEVRWGAMAERAWDTTAWVGSIERAKELLGWEPRRDLRGGLRATLDWTRVRELGHAVG
jgi:nucleoside-diphosphate-sugar epimerase